MQDISRGEGRTVLFVSHNMAAVKSLCTRGIVLEHGKVVFEGEIDNCINTYLKKSNFHSYRNWDNEIPPGSDFIKMKEVKVIDAYNQQGLNHLTTQDIKIEFTYDILKENQLFTHGFNLFNSQGVHILSSHDSNSLTLVKPFPINSYKKTIIIPKNLLAEGNYTCSFAILRYNPFFVEFHEMDIVGFNVS